MLIVSPNSTCDVCMENYMDEARMPHAIACGHIFCRACLDQMQPQCPLCRDAFSPWGIRKLHVDTDDVPLQVQRVLDAIVKTVDGGVTVEELQRVVDQCTNNYQNTQSDGLHTPLGVSYLLLTTMLEVQKKLLLQADQLSELAAAKDHIRDRLTCELTTAQLRNQNLEEALCNEKEAALRNAENAQVEYDRMNALWRCKVGLVKQKYQPLLEELDQLCSTTQTATHGKTGSVSDSAILRHTVVAGGSSGMKTMLDEVVDVVAFQSRPHFLLVFHVIRVSLGCFLFLQAFVVVLQLCAR